MAEPLSFTLKNITLPVGSADYLNDTTGTVATAIYFVTGKNVETYAIVLCHSIFKVYKLCTQNSN